MLSYDNSKPLPGPSYTDEELNTWVLIIGGEVGTGAYFRGPEEKVREAARKVAWTVRNVVEQGTLCTPQQGGCYRPTRIHPYKSYADAYVLSDVYTQKLMPTQSDPIVYEEVQRVFDLPAGTPNPIQNAQYYLTLEFYESNKSQIEAMYVDVVKWVPEETKRRYPPEQWQWYGLYFFVEWPEVKPGVR